MKVSITLPIVLLAALFSACEKNAPALAKPDVVTFGKRSGWRSVKVVGLTENFELSLLGAHEAVVLSQQWREAPKKDRVLVIKVSDLPAFRGILEKIEAWAKQASADKAPRFEKALGKINPDSRNWNFAWYGNGFFLEGDFGLIGDDEARLIMQLFTDADIVIAEAREADAAAKAYADKLH